MRSPAFTSLPEVCMQWSDQIRSLMPASNARCQCAVAHLRNRRTGLADKAVCQATTAWYEVRFAAEFRFSADAQSKVDTAGIPGSETLDMLIRMSPEGTTSADLRLKRIAVKPNSAFCPRPATTPSLEPQVLPCCDASLELHSRISRRAFGSLQGPTARCLHCMVKPFRGDSECQQCQPCLEL